MSLSQIVNLGKEVVIKGVTVKTNGITISNLARLVVEHGDTLASVMGGKLDIKNVYHDAPQFVADVIAWGTGATPEKFREESEYASKLSFIDQLTILDAIWDETVPNEAELKKLLDRLETLLPGLVQHQG